MTDKEMLAFARRIRNSRKAKDVKSRRPFEEEMRDLAVFRVEKNIHLDPTVDAPLPEWARRILNEKCLSKRMVIELIKHHDILVRRHRLSVANAAAIQETQKNFDNNNQEEGDEYDDDD